MPVFPRQPKPNTKTPPLKPIPATKPNKDDKKTDAPSTLPQRRRGQ